LRTVQGADSLATRIAIAVNELPTSRKPKLETGAMIPSGFDKIVDLTHIFEHFNCVCKYRHRFSLLELLWLAVQLNGQLRRQAFEDTDPA
jgi:hypothetical protein